LLKGKRLGNLLVFACNQSIAGHFSSPVIGELVWCVLGKGSLNRSLINRFYIVRCAPKVRSLDYMAIPCSNQNFLVCLGRASQWFPTGV